MFYKQKDILKKCITAVEEEILNEDDEDMFTKNMLKDDQKKLSELKGKISNAENSLGAAGQKMLQGSLKSPYIKKQMNTLAIKIQI